MGNKQEETNSELNHSGVRALLERTFGEEEGESVYQRLRVIFKIGRLDQGVRSDVETLFALLVKHKREIRQFFRYEYFHGLCLVAEFFERFGENERALEALRLEEETILLFPELHVPGQLADLQQRRILREQMRLVLDWADSYHYSRHEYEAAIELADKCARFVRERIYQEEEFPCRGTLGQIYRLKGNCYRRLERYGEAEAHFGKAIINYYLRAKMREVQASREIDALEAARRVGGQDIAQVVAEISRRQEKREADYQLVTRRVAMILSQGFGWIAYRKGQLSRAEYSYLLPARLALLRSRSDAVRAYNRLIMAAVLRSKANSDESVVRKALEEAREAEETFRGYGHQLYVLRANFEMGLCHARLREFSLAQEQAAAVQEMAEEIKDVRWISNALVLQAMIAREVGKPQAAADLAAKALKTGDGRPVLQVEAFLARAEARLALGQHVAAREDLQQAEDLTAQTSRAVQADPNSNPIFHARLGLLRAKSWLGVGEIPKAQQALDEAKPFVAQVEHFLLKRLLQEVEDELKTYGNIFSIRVDKNTSLSFQHYRPRLLEFLIQQATIRSKRKTKADIAEILGVTRQTLLQWEQEVRESKEKKES